MKKIIFVLLVTLLVASVSPLAVCRSNGYESVVFEDGVLFCEHVETYSDSTTMTVKIRLEDILSNPDLWNYWMRSFDELPTSSS